MSIDQFIVSLLSNLIAAVLDLFFGANGLLSGALSSLTGGFDITSIVSSLLGLG